MPRPTTGDLPGPNVVGGDGTSAGAEGARGGDESTGPVPPRRHFGAFESLRATAAVMVVVHHAASYAGPGRTGHLTELAAVADAGVAVFFVLSGFLIYRPFVAADLAGHRPVSTVAFWWRRVLRIVPAYWVALTFFWLLGNYSLGSEWWRYYLFLQIYARETVLGGIVQAWSLCTEMSFYLFLPLWAWLVRRVGATAGTAAARAQRHLAGCAVLVLAAVASRVAVDTWFAAQRGLAFDWLPTNLDLFGAGMALATVSAWSDRDEVGRARLDRLARWVGPWWAGAALLFIWYAYRVGPADFVTGYSGWFWHRRQLVLAAFTVLLMVPGVFGDQARGWLRRAWSWRPLVFVGTVSYGLYLWHFDWMKRSIAGVDGFGRPTWSGWVSSSPGDTDFWYLVVVGLGAGMACASASWYALEQPLQRFKDPRRALGRWWPRR